MVGFVDDKQRTKKADELKKKLKRMIEREYAPESVYKNHGLKGAKR